MSNAYRSRNLQTSKAPLESQAQGISLFTSDVDGYASIETCDGVRHAVYGDKRVFLLWTHQFEYICRISQINIFVILCMRVLMLEC